MTDWHGWAIGNKGAALHVGRHPHRKSVAIMASVPNYGLCALGYFGSERDAELALALIDAIAERVPADEALEKYRQGGEG